MNFKLIQKSFYNIIDALGGGWMALGLAFLVVVGVLFVVLASGKVIKFKIPFLPAPIATVKISKDSFNFLKRKSASEEIDGESKPFQAVGELFRGIDALSGDRQRRYDIPLFLVMQREGDCSQFFSDLGNDYLERLKLNNTTGDVVGDCIVLTDGCLLAHDDPKSLIPELIRSRPERPLDGIVLAVSADELSGLDQRATDALHDWFLEQIWSFQREIPFSLPIYLLIKDSESLPGVGSLSEVVCSLSGAETTIGWSSPYLPDSVFSAEWVEEAFIALKKQLSGVISNALKSECPVGSGDLLVGAASISSLEPDVERFFESVFASPKLITPPMLRGIYLSVCEIQPAGQRAPKNLFIQELFKRKIFREGSVGFPLRDKLFSTDKLLRNLQYASVTIFVALLLWSGSDVYKSYEKGSKIAVATNQALSVWSNKSDYDAIAPLLQKMDDINAENLYCCGPLPVSKVLSLDSSIGAFYRTTLFEQRIFPEMECDARSHLNNAFFELSEIAGSTSNEGFLNWLSRIEVASQNLASFHSIASVEQSSEYDGAGLILEFDLLISALYGKSPPDGLTLDDDIYAYAIASARWLPDAAAAAESCDVGPLDYQVVREGIDEASRQALDSEISSIAAPLDFLAELRKFQSVAVDSFTVDESAYQRAVRWYRYLKRSHGAVEGMDFCSRALSKLSSSAVSLNAVPTMEQKLFDPESFYDICIQRSSDQMRRDNSAVDGRLYTGLALGGSSFSPRLEPSTSQVFDFFDTLEGLEFSKQKVRNWSDTAGQFFWSVSDLIVAQRYADEYFNYAKPRFNTPYLSKEPSRSDQEYLAQAIALSQLQGAMLSVIQEAKERGFQRPVTEYLTVDRREMDIADRVANFERALGPLLELITTFEKLGLTSAQRRLEKQSRLHAEALLSDIDSLFADSRVYQSTTSAGWSASAFPDVFYGLRSDQQIQDYLSAQSVRARLIAEEYAQPVVIFLSSTRDSGRESNEVAKWRNSLVQIDRYRNKNPASSLTSLESFFSGGFASTDLNNCQTMTHDYSTPDGNDIFTQSQRNLVARAKEHCLMFQADQVRDDYNVVASSFDKNIKGKYPFAKRSDAPVLTPAALRAFLADYATAGRGLHDRLTAVAWQKPEFFSALNFASVLDQSMSVVSALIDPAVSGVQLRIDMEPVLGNTSSMSLDRHISAKTFSVGNGQSVSLSRPVDSITWAYGDEMSFKLDWASGSPYQLLSATGEDARGSLDFLSKSPWSLLYFIQEYRSDTPDPNSLNPESVLLQFDALVRTSQQRNFTVPLATYTRLSVVGTDPLTSEAVALSIPEKFPAYAPVLREVE